MNIRTVTFALLPVGFVGAVACSSVSASQACDDLATAICNKLQECASPLLTAYYGDTTTCAKRAALSCNQSLALTNTSDTPSLAETCSQAYANLSCSDAFQNNPPKACQHGAGPLTAGSPCGTSGQCASNVCVTGTNGCGTCGTAATAGAACKASSDCGAGLVCAADASANLRCVAPAGSGQDCNDTPCQVGLQCTGASGAKKCATPLAAGSACDPTVQPCDGAAGFYCNPLQKRCSPIKFAAAGAPCGYDTATGDLTSCSQGFCSQPLGQGTCIGDAADGAACDTTNGPGCLPPATCNNGTCTVTDPVTCK